MNKSAIASTVAHRHDLPKAQATEVVDTVMEMVGLLLEERGRVTLSGFGSFRVKQRKARKARNPRTGEEVDIPATNVVTFKPAPELNRRVANTAPER